MTEHGQNSVPPFGASRGTRGDNGRDDASSGGSAAAKERALLDAQNAEALKQFQLGLPSKPIQYTPSPPGSSDGSRKTRTEAQLPPTSVYRSRIQPNPASRLDSRDEAAERMNGGVMPTSDRRAHRGRAPPRPQRPSRVPSLPSDAPTFLHPYARADLDRSGVRSPQTPESATRSANNWREEDFLSPNPAHYRRPRPDTTSSQGSTSSSIGTIPDFPVPGTPASASAKRSPGFGVPPSARRGPSSYYSLISNVSPIKEETDSPYSHLSYASSNVVPNPLTEYYYDDDDDDDDASNAGEGLDPEKQSRSIPVDRPGTGTSASGRDASGAVGDQARKERAFPLGSSNAPAPKDVSASPGAGLRDGTALLDPSSSDSDTGAGPKPAKRMVPELRIPAVPQRAKSPLNQSDHSIDRSLTSRDGRMSPIPSPASTIGPLNSIRNQSLADRVGPLRPPRLNVGAVRNTEARGSLTSLPDLIMRATRLAANLDRGRTASRLDMDFGFGGQRDMPGHQRQSGSMSDMLNAFPPPGMVTPSQEKLSVLHSRMASPVSHLEPSHVSQHASYRTAEEKRKNRRRRCCGMPLRWAFPLFLVLTLLVAAAIIVPVTLIVIPRQRNEAQNSSSVSPELAECRRDRECQNGGTNIITSNGACRCLCVNGFTGETCSTATDRGCTTINLSGTQNATVGSAIPRLVDGAQANFSIPLDASALATVFSLANLSCSSQNALVTFNGLTPRSIPLLDSLPLDFIDTPPLSPHPSPVDARPTPAGELRRRQDTFTTNGLEIAGRPGEDVTLEPSSAATPTASPTGGTNDASRRLEFARIAVLFLLQETSRLETAASAQTRLQSYFTSRLEGIRDQFSIGSDYQIDMERFTITRPGGEIVGNPNSQSTTPTSTDSFITSTFTSTSPTSGPSTTGSGQRPSSTS